MTATLTAPNQITIETTQRTTKVAKRRSKPIKLKNDDPKLKLATPEQLLIEQLEFQLAESQRFAMLGYQVALHDLATAKGQTVLSVAENPIALAEADLPTDILTSLPVTVREAHKLNRNAIDGMLFRCNAMPMPAPELSKAEADTLVAQKQMAKSTKPAQIVAGPIQSDAIPQTPEMAGTSAPAPRPASIPKLEGPSAKEIVYRVWFDNKEMPHEQLLALVADRVKLASVKSWTQAWKTGKNLPACAKK